MKSDIARLDPLTLLKIISNAPRTMIFNIHNLNWDEEILAELNIPGEMLPKVWLLTYFFYLPIYSILWLIADFIFSISISCTFLEKGSKEIFPA